MAHLEAWLAESLGRWFRKVKDSRMDLLQEQKGAGAGCPNVPAVLVVGEKTCPANRAFFRGLGGKREFMKSGRRGRQLSRAIELLSNWVQRKLEGPKPNWISIWLMQ